MRSIAFLVLMWSLVGCAAQQQQQAFNQQTVRNAEAKQAFDRSKSYCEGLMANPQLDPIRSKAVISNSLDTPPTFDMLANEERVTAAERPVIRDWANLVIQCQAAYVQQQYSTPMHVSIVSGFADSANGLRAQLYSGEITWGQYNRERQKLISESKGALARLNAELAQRGAEAQYRAQQIAQQQAQTFLLYQQNIQQQQQAYQQRWLQQQQHGQVTCQQIGQFTYCNY